MKTEKAEDWIYKETKENGVYPCKGIMGRCFQCGQRQRNPSHMACRDCIGIWNKRMDKRKEIIEKIAGLYCEMVYQYDLYMMEVERQNGGKADDASAA